MSEERSTESNGPADPTDEEVVQAAADAAEGVVLSQYKQSRITDMDVTVRFENGTLDVDVYVNAPDGPDDPDPDQVVEEAVQAATDTVDELFATAGSK